MIEYRPRRMSLQIVGQAVSGKIFPSCKNQLCVNPEHLMNSKVSRFWAKVQKLPEDNGCWIWLAGEDKNGYGKFSHTRAHRYSWELQHGPIQSTLACVCHTCDNPRCVNPSHLFLGENKDNTQDRNQKGRQAKGIKSGSAKLTDEKVKEIRKLYATGNYSQDKLADLFEVNQSHVSSIVLRKTWKHVID